MTNLKDFNNKVVETEYTYELYVGHKVAKNFMDCDYDTYEVAYMAISKVNSRLDALEVAPTFQSNGLASQLMAIAKELGVDNLLAEAHGEGLAQEKLIAFYEKQGFKQVTTNGNSTYMSL